MRRWLLGTTSTSSSSWDTLVRRPESTDISSREDDKLHELFEREENALLILFLAFINMVPARLAHEYLREIV